MRVAIIGAGPAGAHLAYLLGRDGGEVLLFDARPPWEKPCGGGVTSKALREFEFLLDGETPRQMVSSIRLISDRGREARVHPRQDFAIYARAELDRLMRRRATSSGAELHCARVERIRRSAGKWELCTARNGEFICDFLVGADGATSTTRRRLGIRFAPQDFAYSLGWRVKQIDNGHHATAAQADIKYLDGLTGYLWAFPRTDHISYGIVTKYGEATPAALKERLLDLIESQSPPIAREIKASTHHSIPRATFYGAMIPALEAESWDHLSVCNADHAWALIGDAAGFADPITGEGIYYAIKSAGLLAEALRSRAERYDEMWRAEFGAELRRAAQILRRFYHGRFAGGSFTERMVQFAQWHRGVRETLCDLIAGDQGYIDLKSRLRRAALSIV